MIGVGDKVVCINNGDHPRALPGGQWPHFGSRPEIGAVYTVVDAGVHAGTGDAVVFLREITNGPKGNRGVGYATWRFRKVITPKTSIELFKQIDRDVFAGKVRELVE